MQNKKCFTMMVLECKTVDNQMCFIGKPTGDYEEGDKLYIRKSNLTVVELKVIKTSLKDDLMEIYTDAILLPEKIKYAVITNVEPQELAQTKKAIENPFLLGLAREYKENYTEREFLNEFCYSLIHAKFIVPIVSDELGKVVPEEKKVNVKIGFHVVTTQKGRKALPVFTDLSSLNEWKSFREAKEHKTLILSLEQVYEISSKDQDGFIINAFDIGVLMPNRFIDTIFTSDGYKKKDEKMTKKPMTGDKIQIGVPQDNQQIILLKQGINSVGSKEDRIKEGYLFLKKAGEDVSFLVIFDLDFTVSEEERNQIFTKANLELAQVTGGKIRIDYAMKAPHFIKLCGQYEPVYKAD